MKNTTTGAILGTILTMGTAGAAVVADFNSSTADYTSYNDSVSTDANLNDGTTGGTWGSISTTSTGNNAVFRVDAAGSGFVDNFVRIGISPTVNDDHHLTTATLSLDSAQTLGGGAYVSFDARRLAGGGQTGGLFVQLFDGSTQVARIIIGSNSGTSRGTIAHYSAGDLPTTASDTAYGVNRTNLAGEDTIWTNGGTEMVTVNLSLGISDFGVSTSGGGADIDVTSLGYYSGSHTQFDSIVFTALDDKASWGLDNIAVAIPEPSSAALLGLGGLALILRRRK